MAADLEFWRHSLMRGRAARLAETVQKMKCIVRDFVTLFNVLWYRDFPMAVNIKETGSRAEWTTHIGICVRSAADLLGYFTHFEAGNKTDAVIKDAQSQPVANVEWEWTQPFRETFNELEKLHAAREEVQLSVLVTYSRDDHHEQNLGVSEIPCSRRVE